MTVFVRSAGLTDALRTAIGQLAIDYPLEWEGRPAGPEDVLLSFEGSDHPGTLEIIRETNTVRIRGGTQALALRGIGTLLADLVKPGVAYREQTSFETLGMMLDCSRNAVMTPAHFTRWLRRLSLMGYTQAMLYTENTYELPGEEYFGYRRGRYTRDELRDIDRTAAALGIEMIGCIQVLGHLEQLLRWPDYGDIQDTASVLMVGEEKTYVLIEKMIAAYAAAFRSRRIHIGMDETFDLGRGRYLNRFGYRRGWDLFNHHLGRVTAICDRHGLKPMIWSDMIFAMGSPSHDYYDRAGVIPEDVKNAIPRTAQLVYWDYHHTDPAFYGEWIRRHRALGFEPVMASAVWTAQRLWYNPSGKTINPCVTACRAEGVREIFFCLWGDDGAYCEFDSALAGLTEAAEAVYGEAPPDAQRVAARFRAVCGADYGAVLDAAAMNEGIHPVVLLWDDPLLRVAWRNETLKRAGGWHAMDRLLRGILQRLAAFKEETEPVDLAHACRLMEFFRLKIRLNRELDTAYAARDQAALLKARRRIRPVIRALDRLMESFRRQWLRRNKPFGLETIQIRLGGQKERYLELGRRLDDLIEGRAKHLPEFEEQPARNSAYTHVAWRYLAVSGLT